MHFMGASVAKVQDFEYDHPIRRTCSSGRTLVLVRVAYNTSGPVRRFRAASSKGLCLAPGLGQLRLEVRLVDGVEMGGHWNRALILYSMRRRIENWLSTQLA